MKSPSSELDFNCLLQWGSFPPSSFFLMIRILYTQEHHQNSRRTSGRYFYVRTHSLKEFEWSGEWYLPENATFSVYRSEYYHYPISTEFWICAVSEQFEEERISIYPSENVESVEGKFRIIAYSNSKTYAPRLMEWWNASDGSIEYAELCAKYLKPRIKQIPQFELDKLAELKPQPTDAVLGGDIATVKVVRTKSAIHLRSHLVNN
jgi:hypothetical protein